MAGSRGPRLGPALYRALDGETDHACTIVKVDGWEVAIQVYKLGRDRPEHKYGIKFDPEAGPSSAKPGTCYVW